MKYLVVGWNCLLSSGTEENDIMEIYRRTERITLAFLNWMWRLFILIHEWKNIVGKRKLYKQKNANKKAPQKTGRKENLVDKPIRVLHVLQRMEAAGVQTLLMSIYRNLDRDKVQFDFLVHYKEDQFFDREIEAMGGRIYKLSVREDYNIIKYLRELKRFFSEHDEYKIVHGHMPILGAFYLRAAYKAGVPVRIAHAHTDRHSNNLKGTVAALAKSFYPVYANHYFACSDSAGKYIFGERNYMIIRNAIMTERFAYQKNIRFRVREALGVENKFVIGHAGRFAAEKNQLFLIDVFAEIVNIRPQSVLLLAGEGELHEKLAQKVCDLGLDDKVRFLGVRSDINELYQAMDAFVFPSIYEGLGIVSIEAQASGVLTFCSDAIPQEANISPVFIRIPLSKHAAEWAQIIVEQCEHRQPRKDISQYIIEAGYDARQLANRLQNFYLAKDEEHS